MENELITVAMEIILKSGDSRIKIYEALKCAKSFDFKSAYSLIDQAKEDITLAHKAQTNLIQEEAGGKSYKPSLLFTHAQDTLMTIHSELRLAIEMIDILEIIERRTNIES